MSKSFTETPIPLIGKEYYFKRTPNKSIKVFDEKIRDKADELKPIEKESTELTNIVENTESRINNLQKKLDLIDRKEDPSDKELDASIKLVDKIEGLYDDLKEAREKVSEFEEEHKDTYNRIGEEMNEILAEKVETMLDGISKQEFLDEYDVVDMRIVTNLSKYYEMCIIGEKASKIQKEIRDDSRQLNERMKSFRR